MTDEQSSQPKTPEPEKTNEQKTEEKPKEIIKEIHHHHYQETKRNFPFGRIAIGLVLVFIGLVYLVQATGWVNLNFNFDWWKLWPLIFIFWGLSLLAGRGWMSGVIGIVVTITVLAIVALLIFNGNNINSSVTKQDIIIAKEAAASTATVNLKAGAGKITVTGGTTDQLINGLFESNVTTLTTSSNLDSTDQVVTLKEENYNWRGFGNKTNDLSFELNNNIPIKFTVDTGASEMDFDLKEVMAEEIDVNTGASSMKLELGDKVANSTLRIDAGASSLDISLPKTLGAKLVVDSGISSKDLPDFNKIDDKNYESKNYSSSEKKINMTLKMGVSSLKISWR